MTTNQPEWFNRAMVVHDRNGMTEWLCPVLGCPGTMIFNGTSWPTTETGYHHVCSECGITLVIPLGRYPKRLSEEGKSIPPERPGLAWDDPRNLVIETIVKGYLRKLTDAQRVRFIEDACGEFCHHCGRLEKDGRHCGRTVEEVRYCQCQDDE